MSTTKIPVIKVKQGFRRVSPDGVLATSVHVFNNIYNSSFFTPPQAPAPPVDQATLKTANDSLGAAIAAAVGGGRQPIAQRNHAKEAVVKLLEQLAVYVQSNSKGDMNAVTSSGFTALSPTKAKTPPVSETIRKIAPGANSGQMTLVLLKYPGAGSYEVRWGTPAAGGGPPTTWSVMPVTNLKTPITISGLTPGATYVFQARAVLQASYSDWGDPIARIVV